MEIFSRPIAIPAPRFMLLHLYIMKALSVISYLVELPIFLLAIQLNLVVCEVFQEFALFRISITCTGDVRFEAVALLHQLHA